MRATRALLAGCALLAAGVAGAIAAQEVPGAKRSPTTVVLENAAELLQRETPIANLSIYLVGFHPLKDDAQHQMEAHHYCNQLNEEVAQCVLFEGGEANSRLNGIEYIISERLFEQLPEPEKAYWHPHNYEILSGQLVAPGIPEIAEHEAMARKLNSYGKTWHVWDTGTPSKPGDALPLGPPRLAWSFNHDGEAKAGLIESRDEKLGVRSADRQRDRQDLAARARPQCGVDALSGSFASGAPIDGVSNRSDGCPEQPSESASAPH
jgi:uncharacterized protein DUF1264